MVGVGVCIPLSELGWNKLIGLELAESDISESELFDVNRDDVLCVHFYHVEKLDRDFSPSVVSLILIHLRDAFTALRALRPTLRLGGLSALAASRAGVDMFCNRLNFRETAALCDEHVFAHRSDRTAPLRIVAGVPQPWQLAQLAADGYRFSHRCKMLVCRPHEFSVAWLVLRGEMQADLLF